MEIRWSPESIETLSQILTYIEENWGAAAAKRFFGRVERIIRYISTQPSMFRLVKVPNIHEAIITPNTVLIYRVSSTHIELITFWDNRRQPKHKGL